MNNWINYKLINFRKCNIHEYISSFCTYCIHVSMYLGLQSIYPVSFRGDIAKLLLCVSLNERYALMIQLISPAGANRPRTMTKMSKGDRLKGQKGLRNHAVGRAPWQTTAAFHFVIRKRIRVCVKGIHLKGRMRGWRQQRTTSCHPEKPSRQCRLLWLGLRARNFITRLADRREQFPLPRKFVSFIEKTPIRPIGMHAAYNSKE